MADDHLEALAKAQAIAARLRGIGGATVSTQPEPPTDANAVADAALAALGQSTNSGSKRKRWGDDPSRNSGGGGGKLCPINFNRCSLQSILTTFSFAT